MLIQDFTWISDTCWRKATTFLAKNWRRLVPLRHRWEYQNIKKIEKASSFKTQLGTSGCNYKRFEKVSSFKTQLGTSEYFIYLNRTENIYMESGQKFAEALPQEDFVLQVIFGSAVQCHT